MLHHILPPQSKQQSERIKPVKIIKYLTAQESDTHHIYGGKH